MTAMALSVNSPQLRSLDGIMSYVARFVLPAGMVSLLPLGLQVKAASLMDSPSLADIMEIGIYLVLASFFTVAIGALVLIGMTVTTLMTWRHVTALLRVRLVACTGFGVLCAWALHDQLSWLMRTWMEWGLTTMSDSLSGKAGMAGFCAGLTVQALVFLALVTMPPAGLYLLEMVSSRYNISKQRRFAYALTGGTLAVLSPILWITFVLYGGVLAVL